MKTVLFIFLGAIMLNSCTSKLPSDAKVAVSDSTRVDGTAVKLDTMKLDSNAVRK